MSSNTQGTLEDWRADISMPAASNPLMIVAISLGLSGPLLQLLGMEGGGLHIHGASSTGKSTLLRLANSVWTNGNATQSWNGTRNALELIAAHHSGRLLALDEIGEADPRTIGDTAYALANGKGRSRLSQNLTCNELKWQLSVLSSGELSLGQHMGSAGKKVMAGQAVRLLDIPIESELHGAFRCFHDCANAAQFAERINQNLGRSYGVAGQEFVRKLIRSLSSAEFLPTLRNFHKRVMDQLRKGQEFPQDGVSDRALRRFALIALAGELATRYGITGWQKDDAINAAHDVMRLWCIGRDLPTLTDLDTTRSRIAQFVSDNVSLLEPFPCSTATLPVGKKGWVDEDTYYFTREAWELMH